MRNPITKRGAVSALFGLVFVMSSAVVANAGSWNGIEPLKSRRDDVERILGKPMTQSDSGALMFRLNGGTATVAFVDEKFVASKKLRSELTGTVLEIVLQHDHSSDTPESMRLRRVRDFVRDGKGDVLVFRNLKEGTVYTFVKGILKTTRYMASDAQLGRARRSGGS